MQFTKSDNLVLKNVIKNILGLAFLCNLDAWSIRNNSSTIGNRYIFYAVGECAE